MSDRPVRTRFAPSPTGFLHVGAFRTALFSWLLARKHGGRFLLRIEDTDQNRLVPGALEHILRSLQALGIDYDEGPDVAQVAQLDATKYGTVDSGLLPADGGKYGPYFQSLRLPRYREVVDRLIEDGKAYYAFETKEELDAKRDAAAALKRAYLYDRRYREYPVGEARKRVADGEVHVVRLKMPVDGKIVAHDYLHGEMAWDASTQDDFIIQKADGFPPYHLAAMVDDHDMATSHVLRGDDWLPSFPKHSEVFRALDWEPPVFVHCPNVLGPDGKKLSKRHGARPLLGPAPEIKDGKPTGEMLDGLINDDGFLPEALVNFLALIGWSPGDDREVMSLKELLDAFSLDGIAKSGGIFDLQKLTWMNGVYLRQMTPDALGRRALPFLERAGLGVGEEDYAVAVVALEQEKIKKLSEAPALVDFCFAEKPVLEERAVQKWLRAPGAAEYLTDVAAAVETAGADAASIEAACRVVGEKHGREKGEITHPIRVALTGREAGPSLFELMAVLGKGRLRVRFAHALERARG